MAILAAVPLLAWAAPASGQAPGDWTRWKYDAANTGVNPYETRIGPGNARGLRRSWFRDLCCGLGTPLVAGGVVYVGGEDPGPGGPGIVMSLDEATGETRWTAPTGDPDGPSGMALADGRLFAVLAPDGEGSPMVALDAATGRQLWAVDPAPGDSTYFYGPPNVAAGVVYATAGDAKIWALDAATGRLRWRAYVTRTGAATGPVAVVGGLVYVSGADGILLAKDVDNGVNRWKAFPNRDGGQGRLLGSPSVRLLALRHHPRGGQDDPCSLAGRPGSTPWMRPPAGGAGPASSRASATRAWSPRRSWPTGSSTPPRSTTAWSRSRVPAVAPAPVAPCGSGGSTPWSAPAPPPARRRSPMAPSTPAPSRPG